MKALILAGGFGTRLRPLSCTRPKFLFPVANKPLIDWTLENLSKSGVEEVVLAVNYKAEELAAYCGESRFGMKILYSKDEELSLGQTRRRYKALGTGGPVKLAEKLLGDDDFLVLNGDILTNLNYAELMHEHKSKGGVATIALYSVEDPSRYGVAELASDGSMRITRFVEKPAKGQVASNLVNAGVYALSPKIFDYIPEAKHCSMEREVFPRLVAENMLFGYGFNGLWIDIGKKEDYLKANMMVLDSLQRQKRLESPVLMGENVVVEEGAEVGPYVVLGDNVHVGKNASVKRSVVFPGVAISDSSVVEGAVIGEDVSLGKAVRIGKNCIIGDGAIIKDGVTLARDVSVCPFKEVSESVFKAKCLM
ncbi:NDP-sugar synthase [Candidatus Bathyarchaeota archaeon]|nr:MAG: NDP-sugar synthase [Candidatus Bathyarchaeota archaeon]